jgi:hypothetical protein
MERLNAPKASTGFPVPTTGTHTQGLTRGSRSHSPQRFGQPADDDWHGSVAEHKRAMVERTGISATGSRAVATFNLAPLGASGTFVLHARYLGDANYGVANSTPFPITSF